MKQSKIEYLVEVEKELQSFLTHINKTSRVPEYVEGLLRRLYKCEQIIKNLEEKGGYGQNR